MGSEDSKTVFKDWFDRAAAEALAAQIIKVYPDFSTAAFLEDVLQGLESLEMKDRVARFAEALRRQLPEDIPSALDVLVASLPEPLPDCEAVTDGWLQWPLGYFIGEYCVEYYDASMRAMVELTQRFSAEFAVRPFAEKYPDRIFADLLAYAQTHPSPHVRRWASEGIRPRLPWGRVLKQLVKDPTPLWPILEALYQDPELYVRRSVANNLNDIAKDHPELVIACCKRWADPQNDETAWVIRHGLRTLIKQGDPGALKIFGYSPPDSIEINLSLTERSIAVGQSITIEVELFNASDRAQKLAIDYVVGLVRQGGKSANKVFKGTVLNLGPGEHTVWRKAHPMKRTTVRALYSGLHTIGLQVNGCRLAQASFTLLD